MSNRQPALPEPAFGADLKYKRSASQYVALFGHLAAVVGLIWWSVATSGVGNFFASRPGEGIGSSASWHDLIVGVAVTVGIAFLFHWSLFSMRKDDWIEGQAREAIYRYVNDSLNPWLDTKYGITVSAVDGYELMRGNAVWTYRTNQVGQTELVKVSLREMEGIRGYAFRDVEMPDVRSFWFTTRAYDPEAEPRLFIHPTPTKPPAPFEFKNFDRQKEEMARNDRKR